MNSNLEINGLMFAFLNSKCFEIFTRFQTWLFYFYEVYSCTFNSNFFCLTIRNTVMYLNLFLGMNSNLEIEFGQN